MVAPRPLGIAVGATTALCLLGLLGPSGGTVALLFVPLPGLALGGTNGIQATIVASALVAFAVAATLGFEAGCFYLALAGLPVPVTVWALRRSYRIENVVVLAVALSLTGLVALLVLYAGGARALYSSVVDVWHNSFTNAVEMYRNLGVSDDQLSDFELQRKELEQSLFALLPAITIVASGVMWFTNVRLSSRWVAWPQLENLRRWQAPSWLIWTLIAAGWFAMVAPMQEIALIASNTFAVVLACYFCQGLAIVSYFLQRWGLPPALRFVSYSLIVLQQLVAGAVLMLGVFDFWGDFRRLSAPLDAERGADSE